MLVTFQAPNKALNGQGKRHYVGLLLCFERNIDVVDDDEPQAKPADVVVLHCYLHRMHWIIMKLFGSKKPKI